MTVDRSQLPDFMALSSELTAFDEFDLTGTGLAETYFDTVARIAGADCLAELLTTYRTVAADGEGAAGRDSLLRGRILSNAKLGPVARNIIKLWYVGNWYQLPRAWREAFGEHDDDVDHVVSSVAYTEGLLWPAIGANPNGAKGPGYGTWASPPKIPAIPGERGMT